MKVVSKSHILFFLFATFIAAGENRKILALFDSEVENVYYQSKIHRHAEYVLNYLGFIVESWDIQNQLPNERQMAQYYAIFSWFDGNAMKDPVTFLYWLQKQIRNNKKVVFWGSLPVFENKATNKTVDITVINSIFAYLGIKFEQKYEGNPFYIKIDFIDKKMMEFERAYDKFNLSYNKIISFAQHNKSYLTLSLTNRPNSESNLVVTGPWGGIAWGNKILFTQSRGKTVAGDFIQWHLNPFSFFIKALEVKNEPKMDVTVKNGKRIFYSHIDGDGFNGVSEVDKNASCGMLICEKIIRKYPLPVSVSFITSQLDKKYLGEKRSMETFTCLASQENVELASHTFSHPFVWSKEQQNEFKDTYKFYGLPIENYTFNPKVEIQGSLEYISKLAAPFGKKADMIFWSGNCLPEADALKIIYDNGFRNINGGDARFDKVCNSYAYITPLIRMVGPYRQIYTSNCNENIYTNLWTGPFYGFEKVVETFQNTAKDMIYRPINIYYHFYIAAKHSALGSLEKVCDYAMKQDINPVFTSEYIDRVHGFFDAEIENVRGSIWEIRNNGKCRTVRFDNTERVPNMMSSANVLGYVIKKNSLYIHLGEAQKTVLVMETNPDNNHPFLVESNCEISDWKSTSDHIQYSFSNWLKPKFTFGGMVPNTTVTIHIKDNNKVVNFTTQSSQSGKAHFQFAIKPGQRYHAEVSYNRK